MLDGLCGKRLAPFLPEMVDRLMACGELDITTETRYQLVRMSAATIDRRLVAERARWQPKGRSWTKPGSLLKSQIPIRTWADWDDDRPGLCRDRPGRPRRGHPVRGARLHPDRHRYRHRLDGNQAVRNKAQKWVFAALSEIVAGFPFPILGIDSDNGSEFINYHLQTY